MTHFSLAETTTRYIFANSIAFYSFSYALLSKFDFARTLKEQKFAKKIVSAKYPELENLRKLVSAKYADASFAKLSFRENYLIDINFGHQK